jgi:poly-gamma-glutamate capsule biosynthesis protein CapA/YwtB (metallophosphatase superfamily)
MLKMHKFCYFIGLLLCLGCKHDAGDTLTVCFTGDLLLDRGVRVQIERHGADALFSGVSNIFHQSDAVVANLECPVTTRQAPVYKLFVFRAEPQWLAALKRAGITHLAMANNHSYDQGRDGMEDTYQSLISNKLVPVGYGKNHALACNPVIIAKGSIQVAIFNAVQMPLENFPFLPNLPCMCQATGDEMASAITNFKSKHPDIFVVVVLHWGAEYQPTPVPGQVINATKMIDAGADAIIGHHPHVIQTISYIKGKPVFYSLGNFVFDPKKPAAMEGLIVQLKFNRKKTTIVKFPVFIKNCRPILK